MKIFTNKTFTGHYPVGSAAVVLAKSPEHAADVLNVELALKGLVGDVLPKDMIPFPDGDKYIQVRILWDGNY